MTGVIPLATEQATATFSSISTELSPQPQGTPMSQSRDPAHKIRQQQSNPSTSAIEPLMVQIISPKTNYQTPENGSASEALLRTLLALVEIFRRTNDRFDAPAGTLGTYHNRMNAMSPDRPSDLPTRNRAPRL